MDIWTPKDEHKFEIVDGWLDIWDLPLIGPPRPYDDGSNVITDAGRQRGIELVAGLSALTVRHVAIGDNGIVQGPPRELLIPVPATRFDTSLGNEIIRKEADSIVLSASIANEIIYTAEFLTADGPFSFTEQSQPVVNEAGLIANGDSTLFARRTFPSIPFDVGDRLGLRFFWHLQVV